MIDTTHCPECGEIAEVLERAVLESTDGPMEHAQVRCLRRHWFWLPTYLLTRSAGARPASITLSEAPSLSPEAIGSAVLGTHGTGIGEQPWLGWPRADGVRSAP